MEGGEIAVLVNNRQRAMFVLARVSIGSVMNTIHTRYWLNGAMTHSELGQGTEIQSERLYQVSEQAD